MFRTNKYNDGIKVCVFISIPSSEPFVSFSVEFSKGFSGLGNGPVVSVLPPSFNEQVNV